MNLSALEGNQRIKDQLSQQERGRGLSTPISSPALPALGGMSWPRGWRRLCCVPGRGSGPAGGAVPA